jgi:sigma-54 specific flagellar transcriptional regulator A
VTSDLIGNSPGIHQLKEWIRKVAETDSTVLISGESGTGKELVAQMIHAGSMRRDAAFIPINCGAIPDELLESELFGHEKGAFTGAIFTRVGRFESAKEGTLFLDEIGDMPLGMQVKLLRVLQDGYFERVGGNKRIHANVRIIAATNRNLEERIQTGYFREDLYYRLNVFPIEIPSLCERKDDISMLITHYLHKNEKIGRVITLSAEVYTCLVNHRWFGNVRELSNLIERLSILYPGQEVQVDDLPVAYRNQKSIKNTTVPNVFQAHTVPAILGQAFDLKKQLQDIENNYIQDALNQSAGNVSRAAKLLGMQRTTLIERMKKLA